MIESTFVDTNILVYFRDSSEQRKQSLASEYLSQLWDNKNGYISFQVLSEYFVTVTKKIKFPITVANAWSDIEHLATWKPISIDFEVLRVAHQAFQSYSLSWWDSLIIASAKVGRCKSILSEDFSTEKDYLGVNVINPFS